MWNVVVFALLFAAVHPCWSQRRVDPRNSYERILAVVPMVGAGTFADPKRPLFAPVPSTQPSGDRSGIIAFNFVTSDDGRFALVEFVARDRAAFAPILADRRPGWQVFERGKASREAVEAAFKALRKDFDFSRFGVAVP